MIHFGLNKCLFIFYNAAYSIFKNCLVIGFMNYFVFYL